MSQRWNNYCCRLRITWPTNLQVVRKTQTKSRFARERLERAQRQKGGGAIKRSRSGFGPCFGRLCVCSVWSAPNCSHQRDPDDNSSPCPLVARSNWVTSCVGRPPLIKGGKPANTSPGVKFELAVQGGERGPPNSKLHFWRLEFRAACLNESAFEAQGMR